MKRQPKGAVLVTDAARSQEELVRSRHIRYMVMMGVRVGFLVLGATVVSLRPAPLWPWLVLCVTGMVLLPWFAVLVANDRPARSKTERAASELAHRPKQQAAIEQHPLDGMKHLIVDSEVVRERHREGQHS
ncbi:DUF3099 domain-containing protein [Actinoplanes solisilvae]|uniref:DUF3099 domain-containing protein n=1 Tax=Actinoplanes solisilvae TaxID=2486853 RepID=UPI000FD84FF8|nr:DUF3099 domain-containing protein [Actinoplanes solisilvae]